MSQILSISIASVIKLVFGQLEYVPVQNFKEIALSKVKETTFLKIITTYASVRCAGVDMECAQT